MPIDTTTPGRATPAFLTGSGSVGALIEGHDWAATSIGDPAGWPESLRTLVGVMMAARQPMFIAWGPGRTLIYNEPYMTILGGKHPAALGRDFLAVWPEIRDDLLPLFQAVDRGESVHMDDITLFLERTGVREETHFAFSYTPVRGGDGAVLGLFCACTETTKQVMAERRQVFRLALEDELRPLGAAADIVGATVRLLGRVLKASRVGYGQVSGDQVALVSGFQDGVAALNGGFGLERFGPGVVESQRRGETLVLADVREATESDPSVWAAMEVRSVVAVPLVRSGRFVAVLFVHGREPRAWTEDEVELIQYAANRTWDATERAQADAALRVSEAHLAGIFSQTGAGFAEIDTNGRILLVNDHFCTLVGTPRDELLRLTVQDITHPDDLEINSSLFRHVIGTGEPLTVEKRYRRRDGSLVWVATTLSLITATAEAKTLLAVAIDITARKQIETDLEAARDLAEQANLAKSNFIANMSHELRTPLSAIIGYSEMLQEEVGDGGDPAEFTTDMGKIESNARHLLSLINDVLDLSKIESGKMEVFIEAIDVEAMVRDVAATVDTLVAKKSNRLLLELSDGLGSMRSDVTKIRQTLLNLLSNAAKFTEEGTITLSARREAAGGQDRLVFSVRDSGIGMTPEQQAKLFQRFAQADASTTRRFGGTGLGLSITKAFMTMLGGEVSVSSVPGEGSVFSLTVPAEFAEPDRAKMTEVARASLDEHGPGEGAPHRDTVLVIDDDPAQLDLMSRFLEREGFQPRTAMDGPSGLALARRVRPRAILLDVTMPGMDGWAVLRALKEDAELAVIPVIMVTFINDNGLATALGAADHVTKPVKWEEFRGVMDQFREHEGDVLLVDDDPAIRRYMRAALERDGWTVTEAANGKEALEKAAVSSPKVVLLDLEMPVMDGFAFLNAFRAQSAHRDIPVVVITARDLTSAVRQSLRGANKLLNKDDATYRTITKELLEVAHGAVAPGSGSL